MKKLGFILTIAILFVLNSSTFAQKFAYVNSEYILSNLPEYKTAQDQLDQVSAQWQKEIEIKYSEIDKLYKSYQAEQILLTEEMKKKREDEIIAKEKEVKDFQKQKFGVDGDLFKKKQDLVKPVQEKVYTAIKKMAADGAYAFIFDKSSDLIMLYANPKFDKSDEVLAAMGIKNASSGTDKDKKK